MKTTECIKECRAIFPDDIIEGMVFSTEPLGQKLRALTIKDDKIWHSRFDYLDMYTSDGSWLKPFYYTAEDQSDEIIEQLYLRSILFCERYRKERFELLSRRTYVLMNYGHLN